MIAPMIWKTHLVDNFLTKICIVFFLPCTYVTYEILYHWVSSFLCPCSQQKKWKPSHGKMKKKNYRHDLNFYRLLQDLKFWRTPRKRAKENGDSRYYDQFNMYVKKYIIWHTAYGRITHVWMYCVSNALLDSFHFDNFVTISEPVFQTLALQWSFYFQLASELNNATAQSNWTHNHVFAYSAFNILLFNLIQNIVSQSALTHLTPPQWIICPILGNL